MIDDLLDSVGVWLAWIYAAYGIAFLVIPLATFAAVALLALVVWTVIAHAFIPSMPYLRADSEWWYAPLIAGTWILLAVFWSMRLAQDQRDQYGGNMILLNQPLDISIGLAQIKPRTAQTARSLLHRQNARGPAPSRKL
jgi:hypothetical protein